jgi:rpsU-divergently transcribed protein
MDLYLKRRQILNEVNKEIIYRRYEQSMLYDIAILLKLNPLVIDVVFPNGLKDFNLFVIAEINNEFLELAKNYPLEGKKGHEKLVGLLRLKIEVLKKYKVLIKEIMSEMLYDPIEIGRCLWQAADQLWKIVQDRSIDFNYYTKRISLGFIYSKILLFFIQDNSTNNMDTEDYIIREIMRVVQFASYKKKFSVSKIPVLRYVLSIFK